MHRLSDPTETVLSNKITRDRIVLSFKDKASVVMQRLSDPTETVLSMQ